ncbi:hypothetical protein I7I48_03773 [Histoplasma ohiense]|nr:hypothetical protein I7I48_03773 [Histoplasma ohiense (nom. inval.)]
MRDPSFSLMGMPYNGSTLHKGGPLRPRSAIRRIFDGSICSSFPSFGLFDFIFPPRVSLLECDIFFLCSPLTANDSYHYYHHGQIASWITGS